VPAQTVEARFARLGVRFITAPSLHIKSQLWRGLTYYAVNFTKNACNSQNIQFANPDNPYALFKSPILFLGVRDRTAYPSLNVFLSKPSSCQKVNCPGRGNGG